MNREIVPDIEGAAPGASGGESERFPEEVLPEKRSPEGPASGESAPEGPKVEQVQGSSGAAEDGLPSEVQAEADQLIAEVLGAKGQTSARDAGKDPSRGSSGPAIRPAVFEEFAPESGGQAPVGGLDLLMDVPLSVTVELGKARCYVRDILNLTVGSVIELEKLAGDPVDVLVNGKPIARGEVVVLDENFGVRIQEIISSPRRNAKERNR